MRSLVIAAGAMVLGAACRPPPPPLPDAACGAPVCDWRPLARLVDSGVANGSAPGAVVAVTVRGHRFLYGTGRLGRDNAARPDGDTVYDLASLTKVVGLTTGYLFAVDEGRIRLDDPVDRWLPEFVGPGKDHVTIRHLLTHSSGLPAHRALWRESDGRDSALALVNATPLDTAPGTRTVYSDLGAIVLTEILERLYGRRLDSLLTERVLQPLGMTSTRWLPPAEWTDRIAPTERDPWRGRVVVGEVHDENAAWLGGVSGHAGLFSTANDLLTFSEWLLAAWHPVSSRPPPLPTPGTIRAFSRRQHLVPGSTRALGWDTPAATSSSGFLLSSGAFGHTGFTGTSLWIDPGRDLAVVLLTNRVHPTRANAQLIGLRPLVADCAAALTDGVGC